MKGEQGYLLNTDVLFETRTATMHQNVAKFIRSTPVNLLFLSALSLAELRQRTLRSRNLEPETAGRIEDWVNEIERTFDDRILPVDNDAARFWASLRDGNSQSVIASLIAATAASRNLILVTRNTQEVRGAGVRTLNPWHSTHRTRPAPPTGGSI